MHAKTYPAPRLTVIKCADFCRRGVVYQPLASCRDWGGLEIANCKQWNLRGI